MKVSEEENTFLVSLRLVLVDCRVKFGRNIHEWRGTHHPLTMCPLSGNIYFSWPRPKCLALPPSSPLAQYYRFMTSNSLFMCSSFTPLQASVHRQTLPGKMDYHWLTRETSRASKYSFVNISVISKAEENAILKLQLQLFNRNRKNVLYHRIYYRKNTKQHLL